ncbi:MAG: hypothetical protein QF380_07970 [Candidatus Marinimicrobia bacterium]|jgi:hypothetical protein|nr:hypothetical protein [Candidatus Neomarinimicrobiota bacterium]
MIRRLIILLLIVGCAPTKPPEATFYIGMTEKEFIQGNNIASKSDIISKSDKFVKINSGIIVGDTVSTFYAEKQTLLSFYYFEFNYDTLAHVYAGAKNWMAIKPIDYSKYPNSKPK